MLIAGCSSVPGPVAVNSTTTTVPSTRVSIAAEWEIYNSLEEIALGSDAVVVGSVKGEYGSYPLFEPGVDTAPALTKILHLVEIREVIAAQPGFLDRLSPGDEILVSYSDLGGSVENITPLEEGESLALFLVAATFKSPGLPDLEGWEPLSSDSGIFLVDGDGWSARTAVGPMVGDSFTADAFRESVRSVLAHP